MALKRIIWFATVALTAGCVLQWEGEFFNSTLNQVRIAMLAEGGQGDLHIRWNQVVNPGESVTEKLGVGRILLYDHNGKLVSDCDWGATLVTNNAHVSSEAKVRFVVAEPGIIVIQARDQKGNDHFRCSEYSDRNIMPVN